ncbi:MAG: TIGR02269 family lipoprotein [Alphaproteobacteria bacterium]|nr:TIGR02269 family lipoprotein [Alphaproteobacteria bacterium]
MWRWIFFAFFALFTINISQAMYWNNEEEAPELLNRLFENNKINLEPYSDEEGYKTYLSLKHDYQIKDGCIPPFSFPFLASESLFNELNEDVLTCRGSKEPIGSIWSPIGKDWSFLYDCGVNLIPVLPQVLLDNIYMAGCALFNEESKTPHFKPTLAKKWFYRAGIYGHPLACHAFNLIWLMEAADGGIPSANYYLYKLSKGSSKYEYIINSEHYRQRALTFKYPEALTDEAINQSGLKNYRAYFALLDEASQRGSARAKSLLSDIYYYGSEFRKHDPEKFPSWQRVPSWAWNHDFYFEYENDTLSNTQRVFIRRFHTEDKQEITDIFAPDPTVFSENQKALKLLIEAAKEEYPPAQAKLSKFHFTDDFSSELAAFKRVKVVPEYKGSFIEFLLFYFPQKENNILSLQNYVEEKNDDFWGGCQEDVQWIYWVSTKEAPSTRLVLKVASSASRNEIYKHEEYDSRDLRKRLFEEKVIPVLPRIHEIPPAPVLRAKFKKSSFESIEKTPSKEEKKSLEEDTLSITLNPVANIVDFFTSPPSPRRDEAHIEKGLQKVKEEFIIPVTQVVQSEIQKACQTKEEFEKCGGFTLQCLAQTNLIRVVEAYGLEGGKALISATNAIKEGINTLSQVTQLTNKVLVERGLSSGISDPIEFLSEASEVINKVTQTVPTVFRRTHRLITGNPDVAQDFSDILEGGFLISQIIGTGKISKIGQMTSTSSDLMKLERARKGKISFEALDLAVDVKAPKKIATNIEQKLHLALPAPKIDRHHVFNKFRGQSLQSQKYRDFFKKHGIDVDLYTIEVTKAFHKNKIHTANNNWTTRWKQWIDANPNATTKEVYQFGGLLMDEYRVNYLPLVKYKE